MYCNLLHLNVLIGHENIAIMVNIILAMTESNINYCVIKTIGLVIYDHY